MEQPNKTAETLSAAGLAREAVKVLMMKKGKDPAMFDMTGIECITDFYVNVTGNSSTQILSLARELDDRLSTLGRIPLHTEGKDGGSWVLVDYGDVIVNIFDRNSRSFYDLDRHFAAGIRVDLSDVEAEVDAYFEQNQH